MDRRNSVAVNLGMAIGALAFIAGSFLPIVRASAAVGGFRASVSLDAWHSYGTVGALVGLIGIALWLRWRFQPGRSGNAPVRAGRLITVGAIGVLIHAIELTSSASGFGTPYGVSVNAGLGFGLFLLIGGAVVATAAALGSAPGGARGLLGSRHALTTRAR